MYATQAERVANMQLDWMERAGLNEKDALWAAERELARAKLLDAVELQECNSIVCNHTPRTVHVVQKKTNLA